MTVVFIGDEHHRYFQEKQAQTLLEREQNTQIRYWSTVGMSFFSELDALAEKDNLFLIGSRHGAIPAVHWTAQNPHRVARQILLHPSLHLNIPGLEAPAPHFVPTMVICHDKVANPNFEEITEQAGKLFHDYSVHLTSEPAELRSTLSLLNLR